MTEVFAIMYYENEQGEGDFGCKLHCIFADREKAREYLYQEYLDLDLIPVKQFPDAIVYEDHSYEVESWPVH